MNINTEFWYRDTLLKEAGVLAGLSGPQDAPTSGPVGDPQGPITLAANGGPAPVNNEPNRENTPPKQEIKDKNSEYPDITNDPQEPDMEEENEEKDFLTWKREFFKIAIRGDVIKMLDSIGDIRNQKLSDSQRKFVEDNLQILLMRQDANFDKASKEIRRLIREELDQNSPAVSVMGHIVNTLESYPILKNIFIKLTGLYAMKGDPHRKFIAALTGSVQVGSAGEKQDLIYPDTDYSINFSTRLYTDTGRIQLGFWSLEENDPEKFLSDSDLHKLQDGSPEEKTVLRHRITIESIANTFENRAFLINVVNLNDGTIMSVGWDLAENLRYGYKEGNYILKQRSDKVKRAGVLEDGTIAPLTDLDILYSKETDHLSSFGNRKKINLPFLQVDEGKLYLMADSNVLEEIASKSIGMYYQSSVYAGNPSDILQLRNCVPDVLSMVMRRC